MFFVYLFIAAVGGALIPFSLAPFNMVIFSIIAPIIFLILCYSHFNFKQKLLLGFIFGFTQHLIGSSWIYVSIHEFGNANFLLAGFLTLLFILFLSSYSLLKIYILAKYFNTKNFINIILIFPFLWIATDLLQSYLFTGFPWGFLGYAHLKTYLAGYAPIFTVYGVTYFVTLISSMVFYLFSSTNLKSFSSYFSYKNISIIFFIALILSSGELLKKHEWTKPYDSPIKVALVQGNIDQLMKWDENHFKDTIKTYLDLTKPALDSDLIVWPENAIIVPTPYSNELLDRMAETVAKHNANLIAGLPALEKDKKNREIYFNTAVLLNKNTRLNYDNQDKEKTDEFLQTYKKRHLVPFGEYVPFAKYIRGLIDFFDLPMSDFSEGPNNQELFKININNKLVNIATLICFEIAYPFTVSKESKSSNIILTISNDTWFGNSLGPAQHLQIAQMRALENQKPLIRATNNGITAVINHHGQLIDMAPQFTKYTLNSKITPRY